MSGVVHPPESVYTHLMKGADNAEKPPRYTSKFRPTVVLEKKLTKDSMRTMGPPKVEVPSPEKFLKKQMKEPRLPEKLLCSKEKEKEARHICSAKKPAVPARTDEPPLLIHTKRDFTKTNTATLVSMRPQPTCVDNHKGHKQRLENSGLVPKYTKKKDYGEVPEYILQRRERERQAQEEYDNYVKEQKEHGAMTHLSDQERQNILEDLKKNWDELHHEYQGLSLVVDTLTKKTHKERLEAAMKQLEQDINLFERFKTIYVPNN